MLTLCFAPTPKADNLALSLFIVHAKAVNALLTPGASGF